MEQNAEKWANRDSSINNVLSFLFSSPKRWQAKTAENGQCKPLEEKEPQDPWKLVHKAEQ